MAATRPTRQQKAAPALSAPTSGTGGVAEMEEEFLKLQQQYADATIEERERLRPDFIQAIRKNLPGLIEEYDTRSANGAYLKDMFDQCMKRGLARPDLTPDRKTNAMEDAADFMAMFDELAKVPKLGALAFAFATSALFTGLRAGLSPVEVDELRAKFMSEHQRNIAMKGRERRRDMPWREFAKKAALRMHNARGKLTLTEIVQEIEKEWESEKFEKVERQQLFKYLSKLVDKDELPYSMKRRRKISGLRL
jgi:hypothetical protein